MESPEMIAQPRPEHGQDTLAANIGMEPYPSERKPRRSVRPFPPVETEPANGEGTGTVVRANQEMIIATAITGVEVAEGNVRPPCNTRSRSQTLACDSKRETPVHVWSRSATFR